MSLRYLTRRNALNAVTQIPVITNLNHLKNFPRSWTIRRSKHDPKLKSVRPADRIKWWNIVPGDTICLRGDPERTLHEVLSVNRLSNRVFLKNTATAAKPGMPPPASKNYHYSKCQLYIGEAGKWKNDEPVWDHVDLTMKVFAARVSMTRPTWDYVRHCYTWKRYAAATVPKIPVLEKIRIPWPPRVKRTWPKPSAYDTTLEAVQKITYRLPYFNPDPSSPLPVHAPEKAYLDHVYNTAPYDPTQPFEQYLEHDLANPHSRAKKLDRWQNRQAAIEARRKEILQLELSNPDGRTEKQIRTDAAFIWRQEVEKEAKERKKARWSNIPRIKDQARKEGKKAKKEERKRRALTNLALEEEPHQVIPKALKDMRA